MRKVVRARFQRRQEKIKPSAWAETFIFERKKTEPVDIRLYIRTDKSASQKQEIAVIFPLRLLFSEKNSEL